MNLNTLSPDPGSRPSRRRVGRGIGSGLGKTCGKGHKGQKSRAGGYHKINFEGGQMPIQRRLPKMGFKSRVGRTIDEVSLGELAKLNDEVIDLVALRKAGLINNSIKDVKVILSGELTAAIKLKGLRVTKGARSAIESLGGSIEE
ncbi:TPA: 50S ribosomal protein L15 [Legionella pneumophila]|uniref:Large ribosomal subunit protein uL15 n=5 Tax=Legionella pneumophila TaxID=446 RepID=RL15_LEGPH|nr:MULTISPECIES: 50S ribosomal protein L15 [Legionella]Q5WZJ3.1 RecName: Full=Large ribosomal subunit protein uL15; AltName: Full=50S ribosomal protein L15 [Legionella pneumophila str. Lens]Q5X840.1 RecName: Full=Large ribosomal subunit protein uL15; AltName: Full=50S ribosomal protein L15 [Legionella pneumophila str. Paris]Q5ZYM4.1 RecName: Full=Large ribosomal subunit protein uL15; AltName: Full=50S ribosomal protein L15 [Legionella pneumophila subsp. pneumophila str. Philadelphia 1]ERH41547.